MKLQNHLQFPSYYVHSFHVNENQSSPLNKKKIFYKSDKSQSPYLNHFNPHLQKVYVNYYQKKNNQLQPYSYTTSQIINCTEQNQFTLSKITSHEKLKSLGIKMKSLKQISCIQTVSEKSINESESEQNNQLQINKNYKLNKINSMRASLPHHKTIKSSATLLHLTSKEQSNQKLLRSQQFYQSYNNSKSFEKLIKVKIKKPQNISIQSYCDKKTNKLKLNKNVKNIENNCAIQTQTVSVKVAPYKPENMSKLSNLKSSVLQSAIVFDYNKYINRSHSTKFQNNSNSSSHPINHNLFKFFQQQKSQDHKLKMSNLNNIYGDLVNEINLPKNLLKLRSFYDKKEDYLNQIHQNLQSSDNIQKGRDYNQLTQIIRQGPRSYSVGNEFKKLNGYRNNLSSEKRSTNMQSQTKISSGRSSYLSNIECYTPKTIMNNKIQNVNNLQEGKCKIKQSGNIIKYKESQKRKNDLYQAQCGQQQQKILNLFTKNKLNPPEELRIRKPINFLNNPSRPELNLPREGSNNKVSRRRSSKGIQVCSKEKRSQITSTLLINPSSNKNIHVSSKLKSLNEIKNMKKLRLTKQQHSIDQNLLVIP